MRILFIWLTCHLVVAAAAPAIWMGVSAGYPGDSLWTLSDAGRMGVIAISLCGLLVIAAINAWKTRAVLRLSQHRWRVLVWALDVACGVAIFAAFYVLSPQVFYAFYQQIIPNLPDQWVIESAANWDRLTQIAIPRVGASMSDHLAGVAMGGVVIFTAYLHRR